jgi:hypothetical protein
MGDGGLARPVISRRPAALIDDRRGTWFGLRRRTYDARRGACVDAAIGRQRTPVTQAIGPGEGACPDGHL